MHEQRSMHGWAECQPMMQPCAATLPLPVTKLPMQPLLLAATRPQWCPPPRACHPCARHQR